MTKAAVSLRANAPADKAMPLIERYAQLGAEAALLETNRDAALAATNATADGLLKPILDEMALIRAALEPWWAKVGRSLLTGRRKTIELFGCMIGTKAGRSSVVVPDGVLAALKGQRWGKDFIRTTEEVDKTAARTGLTGRHGEKLKALGITVTEPPEVFVLDRVVQDGTQAKAAG